MPSENTYTKTRIETYLVNYYNYISQEQASCYEDIPEQVRLFLSHLDHLDLVKPFVAIDIQDGMSYHQAAIKYGITPAWARSIGRKFGHLPRKKMV